MHANIFKTTQTKTLILLIRINYSYEICKNWIQRQIIKFKLIFNAHLFNEQMLFKCTISALSCQIWFIMSTRMIKMAKFLLKLKNKRIHFDSISSIFHLQLYLYCNDNCSILYTQLSWLIRHVLYIHKTNPTVWNLCHIS